MPIQTLIFTTVTHGPNGQTGSSFDLSDPNERAQVVGRIHVAHGRITSETFTAFDAYPNRGRNGATRSGTITYSGFDTSPTIVAPTQAELTTPALPCKANTTGSCEVTTKGRHPHSAMCKAAHAAYKRLHAQEGSAMSGLTTLAQSGNWDATKKGELDFYTFLETLARVVALSSDAPHNVRVADATELKYLPEFKESLLKAKSAAQFQSLSSSAAAKAFGSFEPLVQYENQQCGGTTSYEQLSGSEGSISTN